MSERKSGFGPSLIVVLAVMFAVFIGWAAWFEIDQTVRAQGSIITSARTQIIQAADGGVLAQIMVQEGQEVKALHSTGTLVPDATREVDIGAVPNGHVIVQLAVQEKFPGD